MKKISNITWNKIESANDKLNLESLFSVLTYGEGILISNHYRKIVFWDMSDPKSLAKISEIVVKDHSRAKIFENCLYMFGDKSIEKIDLSDLKKPKLTQLASWKSEQHRRSGYMIDGRLFVTYNNGVSELKKGKLVELAKINNDEFFKSNLTDVIAYGDYLYVVGRHAGLHIYKINKDKLEFVRNITTGFTPTDLHWEIPGKMLLLTGNEDVILVDTSVPEEAKRLKSTKILGVELSEEGLYRQGKEILLVGSVPNSSNDSIVVVVLESGSDNTYKVVNKQKINGVGRIKTDSGVESNEFVGYVVKDNTLLLFTKNPVSTFKGEAK